MADVELNRLTAMVILNLEGSARDMARQMDVNDLMIGGTVAM